jgi:acetyltransferase-like isoleucine patch superfamily enzyme
MTENIRIQEGATVGVSVNDESTSPVLGPESIIRSGTIIYDDVIAGEKLQTGHHALLRECTVLGTNVLVGTHTVIDGHCEIGDYVSMQTGVYVPQQTDIADYAFLGPYATLLNDQYPVRKNVNINGPTIEQNVSIGGNATVLPEVTVGKGAFVAAGAVVTRDVPPRTLAIGAPASITELPAELEGGNDL